MPFINREMAVAIPVDEVDAAFTKVPAELGADVAREKDPILLRGARSPDPVVDRDPADWIGLLELDRENSLPPPDREFDTGIRPLLSLPPRAPDHSGPLEEGQIGESLQMGAEIEGLHGPYIAMS